MKTQFLKTSLILLSLVFGLTTMSCSDDDGDNPGGNTAAAGTVKADVDVYNFESSPMASSLSVADGGGGSTTMFITATDLGGRNLTLQIVGYNGEGNYDIGGVNSILVTATWIVVDVNNPTGTPETWISPYDGDAVRGFIDVNSDSGDNMQGTFEFSASDGTGGSGTINVTNGSFNLDY